MNNHYTLSSNSLQVIISDLGAELISVTDHLSRFQFIWQGNNDIWPRHAPVLFPIVGKLNKNSIQIKQQKYSLGQHGFARDLRFEPIEIYSNLIKFMLESSEQTKEFFPFDFKFFITYEINLNALSITYSVLNTGMEKMYFSVGAHPGFNLPTSDIKSYQIIFEKEEFPERYLLSDGLLNGEKDKINMHQQVLPLNNDLFLKDAIVLKSFKSNWIKLLQMDGKFEIHMDCPGFPFMGIWTKPQCEDFICLEPWQGIADSVGFEGDISEKEGILCAEPGHELSFNYTIRFSAP